MVKRAVRLGVAMGVFGIAGGYLIVTFLPQPFGVLMPIGGLAVPILMLWPHWFDRGGDSWRQRLVRRLGTVAAAAPVASAISVLLVLTTPYIAWTERIHRESLERQGRSETEVVAALDQHRVTPVHFVLDGAFLAVAPGLIATLVTMGAGAVVWRRRKVSTDARAIATSIRRS